LKELIAKYGTRQAYWIASVDAFRNRQKEAFDSLDRAYTQREDSIAEAS
jgi:hypothetical protein